MAADVQGEGPYRIADEEAVRKAVEQVESYVHASLWSKSHAERVGRLCYAAGAEGMRQRAAVALHSLQPDGGQFRAVLNLAQAATIIRALPLTEAKEDQTR